MAVPYCSGYSIWYSSKTIGTHDALKNSQTKLCRTFGSNKILLRFGVKYIHLFASAFCFASHEGAKVFDIQCCFCGVCFLRIQHCGYFSNNHRHYKAMRLCIYSDDSPFYISHIHSVWSVHLVYLNIAVYRNTFRYIYSSYYGNRNNLVSWGGIVQVRKPRQVMSHMLPCLHIHRQYTHATVNIFLKMWDKLEQCILHLLQYLQIGFLSSLSLFPVLKCSDCGGTSC